MTLNLSVVLKDREKSKELRGIIMSWHAQLQDARGERAKMRREKNPLDIYVSETFRRGIVSMLESKGFEFSENDLERLAIPLGLVSHIKNLDNSEHFAKLFAKSDKGSADMKDVRFRKLLAISDGDHDSLYSMLSRLIKLMGGKAGLTGLLEGACFWNDYSRRRWAEEYYSVKR